MSDHLVRAMSSLIERRTTRRGFIARTTVIGSALAIGPVRYLVYPETAEAVVAPGSAECAGKRCNDGWAEFCCSIGRWGRNQCPSWSYIGGWWKCNNYNGLRLCRANSKTNPRFYVDCNRKPTRTCTCKCTQNKCKYRRTCCTIFKYGQCNTQIKEVTAVVCRVVVCRNPGDVFNKCSSKNPQKNPQETCSHEAVCNCGECSCRSC